MNLKRDNWTNDEVIKILEGRKIYIGDKKRSEAQLQYLERHNAGIEQAIIQFCDFKADPELDDTAMAYDTDDGQIYVISAPLPQ
jgi:hypothetical protein